jgi:hypothetical protein
MVTLRQVRLRAWIAPHALGSDMAFFTCEVVPNLSGLLPHKVVFKHLCSVLGEWPVGSIAEGEAQIAAALRAIGDVVPENVDWI